LLPTEPFEAVAYGVDDITLGFDMEGSTSIALLNAAPGVEQRRGKMLGAPTSWGQWGHLLGRSAAHWKADTKRLYVQAKLAPPGELCVPTQLSAEVAGLTERMAAVGIMSSEQPWVTRLDVAVDARCKPEAAKLLLDALEVVRPPNGWRTRGVGTPRSTVYFMARGAEKVVARAYCRNLKTKSGEPFGLIRLEAEKRFDPKDALLERVQEPNFVADVWKARYGGLVGTVRRLAREVQAVEIHECVKRGELSCQQGERLAMFLDMERLGLAQSYYPPTIYRQRKREAMKLGYASNDGAGEPLDVNLSELLTAYLGTVEAGVPPASSSQ
jgi:hypothetical protein